MPSRSLTLGGSFSVQVSVGLRSLDAGTDVVHGCKYPFESMNDSGFEGNKLGSSVYLPVFDYLSSLERDTERYGDA